MVTRCCVTTSFTIYFPHRTATIPEGKEQPMPNHNHHYILENRTREALTPSNLRRLNPEALGIHPWQGQFFHYQA